ncbi:FAD dependent oxidoreductase, putative [Lunatimonas lonarensis]|uniref:FAD dependent oxidoreductase, putative n=1 Tax=Lunatimonas lonarensis TaxID=1232681 RepID=R7ZPI7_9BACT|nr:NAD(P)/FAD-dependent oxidoreductase [Lunatimonas lonarensis]EON76002.1 FAD dependent oxidoreductase, putative [Lunatimonas lonarensis]
MKHPVVIVGAGLAGLSLAIELSRRGVPVVVLEKDRFPRQKVCGEYISQESERYVNWLGVSTESLPHIHTLLLSSRSGRQVTLPLPKGGFGISRWTLDNLLAQIAVDEGVDLRFGVTVRAVEGNRVITASQDTLEASFVTGAYGRANRLAAQRVPAGSSHYVGVKYQVQSDAPADQIEMHIFGGGYCGFSKVEDDRYCLCYLSEAGALKAMGGDIAAFEQKYLYQNPRLRERFSEARVLGERVTTSQFRFATHGGMHEMQLLTGDAAGFIPPITGNGMSLAFRGAATLAPVLADAWHGKVSGEAPYLLQERYVNGYLRSRIRKGVFLQNLLIRQNLFSDTLLFGALRVFPALGRTLAKSASGEDIGLPHEAQGPER